MCFSTNMEAASMIVKLRMGVLVNHVWIQSVVRYWAWYIAQMLDVVYCTRLLTSLALRPRSGWSVLEENIHTWFGNSSG